MHRLTEPAIQDSSKTLQIGNYQLQSRYLLAPLAGYTLFPFRMAIRELGGIGLATTDLIPARAIFTKSKKAQKILKTSPEDHALFVQIYSAKTEDMVTAAKWLEKKGYAGIDINMGCPMGKVNSRGGGAKLMCNVDGSVSMVAQIAEAVDIPVTVKMRLGWDRKSISAPTLAKEFEKVGIAAVIVHGRTRSQGFTGEVNLDGIRETVEAVENMPVIGNGDIKTVEDAFRVRRETGCAAISIGRGALMDPWIFQKIERACAGETEIPEPTPEEIIDFLIRHFSLMVDQYDEYSCILFRKFAGWYGAKLGIPEDLEDKLRRCENIDEFYQIIDQIRDRHGERESAIPTAMIRVPNGPVERW